MHFYAYTRVIIVLCVVSMEGEVHPYEYRKQGLSHPRGGNNHTYPIVKVDIEADTWSLILFTGNKKNLSDWLLRMKVFSLSLYTTAFNVSPSVRLQEFDDNWSIPLRCHKSHIHVALYMARKSDLLLLLWRWGFGGLVMEQQQQHCGRSSAESNGDPTGALLLSCKLQILAGRVEKPCCLNWERQPSFSH